VTSHSFVKPRLATCPVVSAVQAAAPLVIVSAVLGLGAVLAGCGSSQPPVTPGVVRVVAGENFWGNIAAQIGGRHAEVTSIIASPAADPHLYESDVATAIAVAQAGLVIENGAGYDTFVPQLLSATRHPGRIVVSAQRVLGRTGTDVNPHFWYDIPRVPQVAQAIEAALARLDPPDAGVFAANLAGFDRSLRPVEAVIAEIRRRYAGAPVAYTERVPGYLLQAAGLRVATPPGFAAAIEDGIDPGPGDTAVMNGLITGHKVKVLLYNAQATSPVTQHVRSVARQAGVPVVAVTETMPPSYHSYQAWQYAQASALLRALGG
jgi:zinc/manganese transport system substrate-binding protein